MNTKLAQQLVADFWERAGSEEPFPRQLERSITSTVPVFVVKVHRQRLDTAYIRNQLQRRGVQLPTPWADRRLKGCLVAYKGEAGIFVDGTVCADECRVIVAHEFGHYLAEYDAPRRRALRALGQGILEVLDGRRPATGRERLAAALAHVHIGVYVHYMDRASQTGAGSLICEVEETANVLAAELLAPRDAVLAKIAGTDGCDREDALVRLLERHFGLMKGFAEWYAERIANHLRSRRSFCDILGFGGTTEP